MSFRQIILFAVGLLIVLPLLFFVGRGQFPMAVFLVAAIFLLLIFRRMDLWWIVAVVVLASGLKLGVHDRLSLHQAALMGFCGLGIMQFLMTQGGKVHVQRSLQRRAVWAMLIVLVCTATVRGWGLRIFGSATWGGWDYVVLLSAVSFFLLSHRMALTERQLWRTTVGLMLFGIFPAIVTLFSMIVPAIGYAGRFLPIRGELEGVGMMAGTSRLQALHVPAVWAGVMALLLYDLKFKINPLVLLFAAGAFAMMGLSGHRTVPVMLGLMLMTYLVVRRREVPLGQYLLLVLGLVGSITVSYLIVSYLPITFQRALAVLPGIAADQQAALSAHGTTAWRIDMWRMMLPMIPQYWFIGRGLAFDLGEAYNVYIMASDIQRQLFFIATHAYHNGPLFLLIDLGVAGLISGLFFMIGGVVYFGKRIRSLPAQSLYAHMYIVLFSYYTARVVFFFGVNGTPGTLARLMVIASILIVILNSVERDSLRHERDEGEEAGGRKHAFPSPFPVRGGRMRPPLVSPMSGSRRVGRLDPRLGNREIKG